MFGTCLGYKKVGTPTIFLSVVHLWIKYKFGWVTKSTPKPQLEFHKLVAHDLINNNYLVQEQAPTEISQRKRLKAMSSHSLVSLPLFRPFSGRLMMKLKTQYPQATCIGKITTYCKCSPCVLLCQVCFATHCMDAKNGVIEVDWFQSERHGP